jgi:hypothetical protein
MTNIVLNVNAPPTPDDVELYLVQSNNSIALNMTNITAQLRGDFTYKFVFMDITGVAYVDITDMGFDLETNLTT